MRRLRRAVLLTGCVLGPVFVPGQARAQWTVIDPSNLAQNIEQVARAIEQIGLLRDQIEYQLQALRKLDQVHWRDISQLMYRLDSLMRQGRALGCSLADLRGEFQQTFPGWHVSPDNLTFAAAQRVQAERTLGTMGAGLQVLNQHAQQMESSQATLAAIKNQMQDIEGTQEALELQASLDAFLAEEVQMLRQTVVTQTNLQAVYNAYRVNQEIEMRANYRAMMDRMSTPSSPSERTFSLVPEPW